MSSYVRLPFYNILGIFSVDNIGFKVLNKVFFRYIKRSSLSLIIKFSSNVIQEFLNLRRPIKNGFVIISRIKKKIYYFNNILLHIECLPSELLSISVGSTLIAFVPQIAGFCCERGNSTPFNPVSFLLVFPFVILERHTRMPVSESAL